MKHPSKSLVIGLHPTSIGWQLLACLLHLSCSIDGRVFLHQQLDALQVASSSSQLERGTSVLHRTHHEKQRQK